MQPFHISLQPNSSLNTAPLFAKPKQSSIFQPNPNPSFNTSTLFAQPKQSSISQSNPSSSLNTPGSFSQPKQSSIFQPNPNPSFNTPTLFVKPTQPLILQQPNPNSSLNTPTLFSKPKQPSVPSASQLNPNSSFNTPTLFSQPKQSSIFQQSKLSSSFNTPTLFAQPKQSLVNIESQMIPADLQQSNFHVQQIKQLDSQTKLTVQQIRQKLQMVLTSQTRFSGKKTDEKLEKIIEFLKSSVKKNSRQNKTSGYEGQTQRQSNLLCISIGDFQFCLKKTFQRLNNPEEAIHAIPK